MKVKANHEFWCDRVFRSVYGDQFEDVGAIECLCRKIVPYSVVKALPEQEKRA